MRNRQQMLQQMLAALFEIVDPTVGRLRFAVQGLEIGFDIDDGGLVVAIDGGDIKPSPLDLQNFNDMHAYRVDSFRGSRRKEADFDGLFRPTRGDEQAWFFFHFVEIGQDDRMRAACQIFKARLQPFIDFNKKTLRVGFSFEGLIGREAFIVGCGNEADGLKYYLLHLGVFRHLFRPFSSRIIILVFQS